MRPDEAFPSLNSELRAIAERMLGGERSGHTLQPTAVVNEAYLRLKARGEVTFADRQHFMTIAIKTMNRVLIDHARGRNRKKRSGALQRLGLDAIDVADRGSEATYDIDDLLDLHDALVQLERTDPQLAAVVRFKMLAGWTMKEIAEAIGVSERTTHNDWAAALARLRHLMPD